MTAGQTDIQGSVLENLLDGVLVVEHGGIVSAFNKAAGRILGLSPDEVTGGSFAEYFVAREGLAELSEVVLDAVTGEGDDARQVVTVDVGGDTRLLSVGTSYIRVQRADGEALPVALIAVFSDITELKELRETELRMAKAAEAQHDELQRAYRQIEERNETLAQTLKKVQMARIAATVLVIGVFLGAGVYVWRPFDVLGGSMFSGLSGDVAIAEAGADTGDGLQTMTVSAEPVRETILLSGRLAPWRTITITSSTEGRVLARHFQYGQRVERGDLLMELDTFEAARMHRDAQVQYIDALNSFETVSDWENSPEMAQARRAFARAKMALESQETRLKRVAFLLEQGLIPASEHEEAERQYRSQVLDFESAREELNTARARGGEKALEKAALELKTAEQEMRQLAEGPDQDRIVASLTGVILPSPRGMARVTVGRKVSKGEALLSIGDFSRMAATAKVDEVDVARLSLGQAVTVTGNAFPDLKLRGTVTHVASQPDTQLRGPPRFEVAVTLNPLNQAQKEQIRAGMSCRLRIVVYSKEAALMVPLDAVEVRADTRWVRVIDPSTGKSGEREVQVGPTTRHSVEILAGLQAGEEIAVPIH